MAWHIRRWYSSPIDPQTQASPEHITEQLVEIVGRSRTRTVSGAGIERFGPAEDIRVTVLDAQTELLDLHHRILTLLSTSQNSPGQRTPELPTPRGGRLPSRDSAFASAVGAGGRRRIPTMIR